jgi:hypothetical protein
MDNTLGPQVVIPVKFTPQVKSEIGYGFLSIIETVRYREYHPFDETLRLQLDKCRSEIILGPAGPKLIRWGAARWSRRASSSR